MIFTTFVCEDKNDNTLIYFKDFTFKVFGKCDIQSEDCHIGKDEYRNHWRAAKAISKIKGYVNIRSERWATSTKITTEL